MTTAIIGAVRVVRVRDVLVEALPLRLVRDVGDERGDTRGGRRVLLGEGASAVRARLPSSSCARASGCGS